MSLTFQQQVSRTLIQVGHTAPFFAVLALFTSVQPRKMPMIAATDGQSIFVNPDRWTLLTDAQRKTVICHELLHAALLHVSRRQDRDPKLWNVAADVVVNGILASEKFDMSLSHIRIVPYELYPVEEVYRRLQGDADEGMDKRSNLSPDLQDLLDGKANAELAHHWQKAIDTALKVAGSMPGRMRREYEQRKKANQLNWRDLLWRFLSSARHDYTGYDRRFISRGLYLDALDGYSIQAALAIDTSGSIGKKELALFQAEISSILGAYPMIELTLYYADAELYGPYQLNSTRREWPEPEGGGGTDFCPFFEAIERQHFDVAIYLTDGYGAFPSPAPTLPVLWVLTPIGYEHVPFGQVVQL